MRRGVFAVILAALAPFVGLLAALATLAACDGGQWSFTIPPGDAGAPDARYGAAGDAWARAYCAFQATCPANFIRWVPGQCEPRMTLRCELLASDPDVAFDPQRAASCPEPDAGDCSRPGGGLCLGPGRASLGAACVSGAACQSDLCQISFGGGGQPTSCGVCVGPPCGGSCPAGQECSVGVDGGSACVVVAGVGQPCSAPSDCATFYCAPEGRCGTAAHVGQACSDQDGPPCGDADSFCDATGHCRLFQFANYGESCAPSGDDVTQCRGLGACDITDNLCIPPAGDGEFCDDSQGLNCLYPALCTGHECVFPNPGACGAR